MTKPDIIDKMSALTPGFRMIKMDALLRDTDKMSALTPVDHEVEPSVGLRETDKMSALK